MPQPALNRRSFLKTSATVATAGIINWAGQQRGIAAPLVSDNPIIQKGREVALSILKPNEKDLTRGLELHANSVVFESYGFAPRAALDGDAYRKAFESGASDEELVDLREEMSMTRAATSDAERRELIEAMQAAGVTGMFQNVGEEGSDPLRLLKRLARFQFTTDELREEFSKAVHPDDVVAAKKAGKHCIAFTTNGVPLRQQWISTRDELRHIRLFRQLGVRMMHLTYNRRNPLGDGAGEPNDGGVSDFGRQAIAEMNQLGVIVDVAHSGWRTSLEAAQASRRPMVASHTTCAGLYKHFRGKPDDAIKAICDTGGLIGICCIPRFLGGAGDVAAFLDHIDYAVKKFGAEHVAIGPDISYVSRNDAAERAKIPKRADGKSALSVSGPRWEHLWPQDDFRPAPHAEQSLAWTNWPLFTVGLVQRGHSDDVIRKILGENVLRVWRANE